ncbi:hypothetical protein ElyMa_001692200 [Elysia marginata]|uniref:Arrestin-like N-terminal domain-containing protein n=1 Tax=Elysia marginata TaxID=1093978 RepID=A0AAV4JS84_9GAST|nr:hypothetical protein ElyMa_001692200 [Elysia marginata]
MIEEKLINVASPNPFNVIVRGGDGVEISSTKLTISDLPISVASDTVETALIQKGLKIRSRIKMEAIRDPNGNLTEWLSGRRFVYIDVPKINIQTTIQLGQFKARLYYKEIRETMKCKKLHPEGPHGNTLSQVNEEICYTCSCKKPWT